MDAAHTDAILEYDGYDLGILGEPVFLAAKASGGFRNGVIALTETRFVYLRKDKNGTFVDRESQLSAVTEVVFKKFLGTQQLIFVDAGESLTYYQHGDDLEPFLEPLVNSAGKDPAIQEETLEDNPVGAPRVAISDDKSEYCGINLGILDEPVAIAANVSSGFSSGVIALTDTKLVYLRKKRDESYIDRETMLDAVTDVTLKPGQIAQLHFKDEGKLVIYNGDSDDLEPFVEPLQATNDAKRQAERDERLTGILCSAQGRNGQVHLFEDRVLITRQGVWSTITYGFRGDKEILISEITSIGWKEPGWTTGYIHFEYVGGQAPVRTGVFADDSIANNENAVLFTQDHQKDFEQFRKLLEEKRAELRKPQQVVASVAASPMEELKKLAELKEMGIVSEEEFEAKKKQLLGL